jgi:non-specific serine/threonine protein kinase/serine/threonine-protein kinase
MSTSDWSRITEIFDEARQRPRAEREAFLRTACEDQATRAEVEAMLRTYDEDPDFLESPADAAAAIQSVEQQAGQPAEGRRLGPYRIVREIGRGGMGVVYEARRDDEEFERRVAIKGLPVAWAASALAERFRFERRVLAGLDHPNIARLLDAGTTDDGVPYFVMEYVDGQPIDAWCRERGLTVRQRVAVLQQVCSAVAHAHENLVVHRDLKPANILMTTDGVPKLLDFGIATLVSVESGTSAGLTRTGQSSFTPEYASPEQVRGERVTTTADVYSLGVLAYRLLSGRPPYSLQLSQGLSLSPLEAARVICEVDPPAPSSVAPSVDAQALRGDLDTVVLKALRKHPRERYASVFALSADLAAWMEGRLVSATPATLGYRVRKFVARNRTGVVAAAAVVLALAAGGVTTAWQARIAGLERDKAQNRFRQVRQFSRSLLFEVHETLRGLPGATEPRRLLLNRAVQFLDGLAADAGDDDQLKLELAQGYRRLGQVQGSNVTENIGDTAGAIVSLEKAVRLVTEVLEHRPDSPEVFDVATGSLDDLAAALSDQGNVEAADKAFGRHLALVERLEQTPAGTQPGARASIAASYVNMGQFRASRGDRAGAQAFYDKAIGIYEGLPTELRERDSVRSSYAVALKRAGALLLADGKLDEGERRYKAALALDEALVARHPDNATYRYDMTFSLSDLAFAARKRGDPAAATALWTRALEIRQAALDADPKNVRAMQGVASLHGYLGTAAWDLKQYEENVAHRRESLRLVDALIAIRGAAPAEVSRRCWARLSLAASLIDVAGSRPAGQRAALLDEASALLQRAEPDIRALASRPGTDPGLASMLHKERARLQGLR